MECVVFAHNSRNRRSAGRAALAVVAMLGGAASLTWFSPPVHADSMSFATGHESNGGTGTCVRWNLASGAIGLTRYVPPNGSCLSHYFMPLYWRNFYSAGTNRTIVIRGRRANQAAKLDCDVHVYDSQGVTVSQAVGTFPVTGTSYGDLTLVVNSVTSSSTSTVACTIEGDAWALKINWTP
jgi:hypothetical protein